MDEHDPGVCIVTMQGDGSRQRVRMVDCATIPLPGEVSLIALRIPKPLLALRGGLTSGAHIAGVP